MADPRGIAALIAALLILDWFFVGITLPGDPIFQRIAEALASTIPFIITERYNGNTT